MKFIAIEKELCGTAASELEPHLKDEAKAVYELQQTGEIREIYFREDRNEAVLILECPDLQSAREILETLPLVKNNLIDFDLIPLKPYPGLARLFTK